MMVCHPSRQPLIETKSGSTVALDITSPAALVSFSLPHFRTDSQVADFLEKTLISFLERSLIHSLTQQNDEGNSQFRRTTFLDL